MREIALIVERITQRVPNRDGKPIRILEFGSGNGFQIPYLATLGEVVASDVYCSDEIRHLPEARFVQGSVSHAPFGDEQFDVVFSNHVIEHLDDLIHALRELRRIGRPSCLYAFSVPTSTWLLLSIPAQYYVRLRRVTGIASLVRSLRRPGGHGTSSGFCEGFRDFRIGRWQRLFAEHGFASIEATPLLLYGPSEWPIIPTMKSVGRFCSSVLFLMTKT